MRATAIGVITPRLALQVSTINFEGFSKGASTVVEATDDGISLLEENFEIEGDGGRGFYCASFVPSKDGVAHD